MGAGPWPAGETALTPHQALFVGSLLLIAAAGKSALVPFSGWLPRAMEGPTPSSAIFYGALSVHLGAFLLLRVSPILAASMWLSAAVVAIGLMTALFAAHHDPRADRHQELAGVRLADSSGHYRRRNWLRLTLRRPDSHYRPCLPADAAVAACPDAVARLSHAGKRHRFATCCRTPGFWERTIPERAREWGYRFAMERGYLDSALNEYVVYPFSRIFQWCDAVERRWTDLLSGGHSRESDDVDVHTEVVEELRL